MKFSTIILASAMLAGSAGLALAQPAPPPGGGRAAVQAACSADIQANCAGQAGRGIRQCLNDNQAKLSDGCKAALAQLPPPGAGRGQ